MKMLLRQIRKERGLTQVELGELSEVSKSEISNIEKGDVIPRLDIVLRISNSLMTAFLSKYG